MTQVHYSDDNEYAYCAGAGMHGFWMSTKCFPCGTYATKHPNPNLFTPNGIQLKHPDPNQPDYERFVLDFVLWKVQQKLHTVAELPDDDLFVLDYKLHQEWRNRK